MTYISSKYTVTLGPSEPVKQLVSVVIIWLLILRYFLAVWLADHWSGYSNYYMPFDYYEGRTVFLAIWLVESRIPIRRLA